MFVYANDTPRREEQTSSRHWVLVRSPNWTSRVRNARFHEEHRQIAHHLDRSSRGASGLNPPWLGKSRRLSFLHFQLLTSRREANWRLQQEIQRFVRCAFFWVFVALIKNV